MSRSFFRSSRCFFHSARNACWPAFAAAPADRRLASISSARVEKVSPRSSTASSTCLAAFFHASPVASAAWSSLDLVSAWRFFRASIALSNRSRASVHASLASVLSSSI